MKALARLRHIINTDTHNSYRNAILKLLEPNPKARIVDLGCGDCAVFAHKVRQKIGTQNRIVGLDLKGEDSEDVVFKRCDLERYLPFSAEEFDVAIASQIIEHLHYTDLFAKEIYKILKPDGYAIFATPNLAAWHNILYLIAGKQPETATVSDEMYPGMLKQASHLRIFTSTELLKFLKFHGFRVEKVVGCTYLPFTGKIACTLATLDWRHCGTIVVKAVKDARNNDSNHN